MENRNYKKDEVIFLQDSTGAEFYEVCSGEVFIYAKYKTEGERLLATIGEGEYFGEMGVIEKQVRSATAVAKSDCTLAIMVAENFPKYIQENPEKAFKIMSDLSNRLRELTVDYMTACHTIAASNSGKKEKEGWLKENIKKFTQIYNESMEAYYTTRPEDLMHTYGTGYYHMYY